MSSTNQVHNRTSATSEETTAETVSGDVTTKLKKADEKDIAKFNERLQNRVQDQQHKHAKQDAAAYEKITTSAMTAQTLQNAQTTPSSALLVNDPAYATEMILESQTQLSVEQKQLTKNSVQHLSDFLQGEEQSLTPEQANDLSQKSLEATKELKKLSSKLNQKKINADHTAQQRFGQALQKADFQTALRSAAQDFAHTQDDISLKQGNQALSARYALDSSLDQLADSFVNQMKNSPQKGAPQGNDVLLSMMQSVTPSTQSISTTSAASTSSASSAQSSTSSTAAASSSTSSSNRSSTTSTGTTSTSTYSHASSTSLTSDPSSTFVQDNIMQGFMESGDVLLMCFAILYELIGTAEGTLLNAINLASANEDALSTLNAGAAAFGDIAELLKTDSVPENGYRLLESLYQTDENGDLLVDSDGNYIPVDAAATNAILDALGLNTPDPFKPGPATEDDDMAALYNAWNNASTAQIGEVYGLIYDSNGNVNSGYESIVSNLSLPNPCTSQSEFENIWLDVNPAGGDLLWLAYPEGQANSEMSNLIAAMVNLGGLNPNFAPSTPPTEADYQEFYLAFQTMCDKVNSAGAYIDPSGAAAIPGTGVPYATGNPNELIVSTDPTQNIATTSMSNIQNLQTVGSGIAQDMALSISALEDIYKSLFDMSSKFLTTYGTIGQTISRL